jgi:ribonuclease PH
MLSNCIFPSNVSVLSAPLLIAQQMRVHNMHDSLLIELGGSKIVCKVLSPRPVAKVSAVSGLETGYFECKVSFAAHVLDSEVALVHPIHDRAVLESRLSQTVQDALLSAILLDSFPKSVLTFSAVILASSVQDLSALINGASLALSSAAVEMRDLVCSCSLFFLNTKQMNVFYPEGEKRTETKVQKEILDRQSTRRPQEDKQFQLVHSPSTTDITNPGFIHISVSVMPQLGTVSSLTVVGKAPSKLIHSSQTTLLEECRRIRHEMKIVLSK